MNTTTKKEALAEGMRVRVWKGCSDLQITKGTILRVKHVEALGPDFSHQVRVVFTRASGFMVGDSLVLYARHPNRLSDATVHMNNGNPLKKIELIRIP